MAPDHEAQLQLGIYGARALRIVGCAVLCHSKDVARYFSGKQNRKEVPISVARTLLTPVNALSMSDSYDRVRDV